MRCLIALGHNFKIWSLEEPMRSKEIVHSIQNHLLYLLAKFQGKITTRTWATSNFQKLLKMGNYFCELAACDVAVRLWRFAKAFLPCFWSRCRIICAKKFLHSIYTTLVWQPSFMYIFWAIILRIWLIYKMLMFCFAALHIIQAMLYVYLKETKTKYR